MTLKRQDYFNHKRFVRGDTTGICKRLRGTKPPKLRWQPLMFFRDNTTNILYCLVFIYRTADSPFVWKYVLEERKDLFDPFMNHTDTLIFDSYIAALIAHDYNNLSAKERILYDPLYTSKCFFGDADYAFGDRTHITASDLLNNFTLVSSGVLLK